LDVARCERRPSASPGGHCCLCARSLFRWCNRQSCVT
jgi:hypothetical protein